MALCAGVGGLDLAVGLLVADYRTICYVEREAYAASTLVARMADGALDPAPVWDDVCTFRGGRWRGQVDLVTAGFPCTPWSAAGAGRGVEDERWIWPALLERIREIRPTFVFLENVPPLVSRGGLALVLGDLAECGFDAEWDLFAAADVGASHQRERLFVLAFRDGGRLPILSAPHDDDRRDASGDDADRCDAPMGEPECRRRVLRERCDREPGGLAEFDGPDLADASGVRLQGFEWDGASDGGDGPQASRPAAELRDASLGDAARGGLGVLWESSACDGFADRADAAVEHAAEREHTVARAALAVFPPAPGDAAGWRRVLAVAPELAPALAPHTQSAVRLLVDESSDWVDRALAARVDQLRALGNAVVPVCAAVALYVLAERARLLTKEAEICLGSTAQPS